MCALPCGPDDPAAFAQDPGNLESDLQAGAHAGYSLLWMFMWSTMMVRERCLSPPASRLQLTCAALLLTAGSFGV